MYIPNDDKQNYHFCGLQWVVGTFRHSNDPANQNSIKGPKVVKPINKRTVL